MNGGTPRPGDSADRVSAATCFDSNLVVVAGAGTGKTSLLVERVLNAVGSGRTTMEQIAAITFTKKAAGEMLQRVTEGLERLLHLASGSGMEELDRGEEADRAFEYLTGKAGVQGSEITGRALAALNGMDRATIGTIHQFCTSILRSYPLEAGVDPSFEVDEGPYCHTLLTERWEDFIGAELGARAPRIELWRRLLARLSLDEIGQAASELARFDIPAGILEQPLTAVDARELLNKQGIEARLTTIDRIRELNQGMHKSTRAKFEGMREALNIFIDEGLGPLQEFIAGNDRLRSWIDAGSYPTRTRNLQGVTGDIYEETGRSSFALLRLLMKIDEELIGAVIEAVAPFVISFREDFLGRGFMSYDGLLSVTRDLLRDRPEIRERIRQRFSMLLLDEFQDTDPLQYEIVLYLGEIAGGKAWKAQAAELQPGRLFIVGDPKQSIYRFRGADYEAFESVTELLRDAGGKELTLTRNFRSVPDLLEPINILFGENPEGIWRASRRYQPAYIPITSNRSSAGEARIEIWTVGGGRKLKADERRALEGLVVAEGIERIAREAGSTDEPDYTRITVLLRAFSNLDLYLQAFRGRGIPYVVDGGKGFMERPEVGHLSAALKALLRPADQAALLAFLRSPAGGVSDVDLARFRAALGRWDWRSDIEAPEDHPAINAAFDLMKRMAAKAVNSSPDEIVRHVLEDTGLISLSGTAHEGPQRIANLRKIANTAAQMARDGRMSLVEVIEALEDDFTSEVESESPMADETTNAVRVLTIHKAKGLENDVIIVPDLAGGRGNHEESSGRNKRLPDGSETLALKIGNRMNLAQAWYELEEEKHGEAEDLRLLYVAMTRARERLILISGNQGGRKPWVEALASWGYDPEHPPGENLVAGIDHLLPEETGPSRSGAAANVQGIGDAVGHFRDAVERSRAASVAPFRAPSKHEDDIRIEWAPDDPDTLPYAPRVGRDVGRVTGTIVHCAMEHWEDGEDRSLLEFGDDMASSTTDIDECDRDGLRSEVREVLEAFLASPLTGEFGKLEIVGREVPMLMDAGDGAVYRGSIDLLYRDRNGEYVVADFKTDETDDPSSLAERYGNQLTVYAQAVMRALGLPSMPLSELWHMRSGRIISLGSSLKKER